MTDNVAPAVRSRMMRAIRAIDTAPERMVRSYLHAVGLRFRLHDRSLPGRPDVVLGRRKIAIFVHGCFWHQHRGCPFATTPSTRPEFWQAKFASNRARDLAVTERLAALGWQVLTIWECEARDEMTLDALAWEVLAAPATPRNLKRSRSTERPT